MDMQWAILTAGLFGLLSATLSLIWTFGRAARSDKERARAEAAKIAELTQELATANSVAQAELAEKLNLKLTEAEVNAGWAPTARSASTISLNIPVEYPAAIANAVEGLIESYHKQALHQARVQFNFSIAAATVGFIIIVAAFVFWSDDAARSSWLKVLPGALMEAVAFLFFKQATETRQRATELYDRLRKDRQLKDASVEVAKIVDPAIRSITQAQIAMSMAGLQPTGLDFNPLLLKTKAQ
jgi:hypothetical protein